MSFIEPMVVSSENLDEPTRVKWDLHRIWRKTSSSEWVRVTRFPPYQAMKSSPSRPEKDSAGLNEPKNWTAQTQATVGGNARSGADGEGRTPILIVGRNR